MRAMGLRYFKRTIGTDPKVHKKEYPQRSGQQDTPLKPRHRLYFNAPIGATQGKIGFKKHGNLSQDMSTKGRAQRKGHAINP
jgi:hypothetical protein